ncbi:TPA: hypothetical protein ACN7S4_003504 [Klebsiella pneumoniae]
MTDITELAQRLKAEGISSERMEWLKKLADMKYCARNPGHWLMSLKETNYLALVALKCIENNLSLVEALEKAQQHIARQEQILLNQDESLSIRRGELEAAHQRIAQLESRTVTPVTYSENADADYCRKWAWEQVKGEVSTEDWTTGDSITYFGFFCWGWDMRRQYNEQRPVTVKLPQRLQPGADGWDDWYVHSDDEGEYLKFDDVLAMLTAAGIKVEAE